MSEIAGRQSLKELPLSEGGKINKINRNNSHGPLKGILQHATMCIYQNDFFRNFQRNKE